MSDLAEGIVAGFATSAIIMVMYYFNKATLGALFAANKAIGKALVRVIIPPPRFEDYGYVCEDCGQKENENTKYTRQQAREVAPRRRNHHWPCRWDWLGWTQDPQRRPDQRPQRQCHELRQVHSRHGGQHRPEEIPGGPEGTPYQCVSAHAHPLANVW